MISYMQVTRVEIRVILCVCVCEGAWRGEVGRTGQHRSPTHVIGLVVHPFLKGDLDGEITSESSLLQVCLFAF